MKYHAPFGQPDPDASYQNGNPGAGIEGSIPPAEAIEQAQREIVAVIEAAGLTPSDGDLEQLKKALAALHAPAAPTWWRLSAPAVTLVDDIDTQIGSFGASLSRLIDTTVNASSGAVTIGTADAGVYVITAAYNTTNQAQEEAIRIVVNGDDYAVAAGCSPTADNSFLDQSVSTVVRLAAGDIVTTRYRQKNAGGATRALAALERDHFSGVRIGN